VALALPLVQQFEGCQLSAYPDPETGAEPWTIGWGSTSYADGTPVQAGDTIGQEQADALLASRLKRDGAWLDQRIPGWAASPWQLWQAQAQSPTRLLL
jgi:GH24 family phage-related lysozyme (muramidase)